MDAVKGGLVVLCGAVVPVDDDRADVNDAICASRCGGIEHVRGPADVHADEVVHRTPLVNEGRRVDDEICAVEHGV